MDPSSPEFVAGRVVATFAFERFIRERSAPFVWGASIIAALLVVATVVSDGLSAVLLGLLALAAVSVAVTLWAVRTVVTRAVRRVGGGRDYPRLRPLVAKRMDEIEQVRSVIPLDPPGMVRFAWMARRPRDLSEHLRRAAQTAVRTMPEVVADVRRELGRPTVDV